MKNIIFTAALLLICLTSNAQITRTILGFTLGKSTKQQVVKVMEQNGYNITCESVDRYEVFQQNVPFGGQYWPHVIFEFVDGILSNVGFVNNDLLSSADISGSYEYLKKLLRRKYSNSFIENRLDAFPNGISYSDDETRIILVFDVVDNSKNVALVYEDKALVQLKEQLAQDEL